MQGVEILNVLPIYSSPWALGFLFGLAIALLISIAISFIGDLSYSDCVAITAVLAVIGMSVGLIVGGCSKAELIETRYEVRLDDTVDLDEFMDKYEFIEQRENSWIVRERVNED